MGPLELLNMNATVVFWPSFLIVIGTVLTHYAVAPMLQVAQMLNVR